MLFDGRMSGFIAFEPSLINDDLFFSCLSSFSSKVDGICQIVIEILDDNDMEKKSDCYEIGNGVKNKDDWFDIFNIDLNNAFYQRVGIYSDSQNWGIYIDNADFEIGIVGFEETKLKSAFFECFPEDKGIFQSVEEYIRGMDQMLNFSPKSKQLYNSIIEKYS